MMNLISSIGYIPVEQDIITRETIELIAQQTYTTQLVIVLVLVIAVGGTIAFFTLRGGIKVFQDLSRAIENSNDIEKQRAKQHQDMQDRLVELVEAVDRSGANRFQKAEDIFKNINDNITSLNSKITDLKDLITNNPQDEKMYKLLLSINRNLEKTKEETDELKAIQE